MSRDAWEREPADGFPGRRAGGRCLAVLLALALLLIPALASASYTVQSGDVLAITVLGAPGFNRHVAVDAGGDIALPVVGDVAAAGLTLPQLRDKLNALLVAKNVVREPEVMVEVSEYRPIYVSGDVMKPGVYPYRIGMNVRDAVALAEGYDLLHLRGQDMMIQGADARGQYNGSGVDLARQTVRIARIRAELAGSTEIDAAGLKDLPVKPEVLSEIIQAERQQLAADNEDAARQKGYLERTIAQTKEQLSTLTGAAAKSQTAYTQSMQNVARANDLLKQGLIAKDRVENVQGAAVTARGSLTDVTARAAQARQDLANYSRQLQQVDSQRHIALLQDLQQAVAAAATARAQMQAAAQKVIYTSAAQQQLASGTLSKQASIIIYRQTASGKQQQVRGDETTTLTPGDNVQVTSQYDFNQLLKGASSEDESRGPDRRVPVARARDSAPRPDATLANAKPPAPRSAAHAARR